MATPPTPPPSPGPPVGRGGLIATALADYDRSVLAPAGILPGSVQHQEMRRSFYAGALCMFHTLAQISGAVPDDDPGLDAGAALLETIAQEFRDYQAEMEAEFERAERAAKASRDGSGAP